MTINTLTVVMPTPPDPATDNNDTFPPKATAFTLAMKQLGDELTPIIPQMNNDIAAANTAAATAVNAPGTAGTSTTSMTVGTGDVTFTTQTGKAWSVGQTVAIAVTASPTTQMVGPIKAYNSVTGSMTVNVQSTAGAGTYAAWTVALSSPVNSGGGTIVPTGGTSTAYTLTPTPAAASYSAGASYMVQFHAACGDNPTLQISGLASPPNLVKRQGASYANLVANDIPAASYRARVTLISATQAVVESISYQPGEVIQEVTYAEDAGGSTTSTTFAAVTASAKSFTPKSTNSIIEVTCSFYGIGGATGVVGSYAVFQIMEGGVGVGYMPSLGTLITGTAASTFAPVTTTIRRTNAALTARSYTLSAKTNNASAAAQALGIMFTIREIQQ